MEERSIIRLDELKCLVRLLAVQFASVVIYRLISSVLVLRGSIENLF